MFLLLARVPMPTVRQLSAMSAKRYASKVVELAKDVSYGSGDEQDLGDDAANDAAADDDDDEVCRRDGSSSSGCGVMRGALHTSQFKARTHALSFVPIAPLLCVLCVVVAVTARCERRRERPHVR